MNVECLMEDEDLNRNLTRKEFEEMMAPMVDKVRVVLQETYEAAGLKPEDIHSVEMVGEATRIPAI